jgi:hypothetical protein
MRLGASPAGQARETVKKKPGTCPRDESLEGFSTARVAGRVEPGFPAFDERLTCVAEAIAVFNKLGPQTDAGEHVE